MSAKKDFFFGRYFKCSGSDGTVALIPALHRTGGVATASVQLITDEGAWNVPFDVGGYKNCGDGFGVTVGSSSFTREGIVLDLKGDGLCAHGSVSFGPFTPIRGDIMGPFRFVPFMECRHSVCSACHDLSGSIEVNGKVYRMDGGKGYIEGDRGTSFPEVYSWTHTHFPGGSLMLSVASIPVGPLHFTGVIGFVMIGGKEYRIATYRGAKATVISGGRIEIRQGKLRFTASLIEKRAHPLKAPSSGAMVRTIRESASCRASYRLVIANETVLDLDSSEASFEYEFPE